MKIDASITTSIIICILVIANSWALAHYNKKRTGPSSENTPKVKRKIRCPLIFKSSKVLFYILIIACIFEIINTFIHPHENINMNTLGISLGVGGLIYSVLALTIIDILSIINKFINMAEKSIDYFERTRTKENPDPESGLAGEKKMKTVGEASLT